MTRGERHLTGPRLDSGDMLWGTVDTPLGLRYNAWSRAGWTVT